MLLKKLNSIFFTKENFGNLRVANELDKKRALKYALKKTCELKGYMWVEQADEFTYDCKHTKETCNKESVYPTKAGDIPKYYEWREPDSKDALNAAQNSINLLDNRSETLSKQVGQSSLTESENDITKNGICIIGNEYFRETCESNKLTYDKTDGSCKTNRSYCASKCLPYCNGDCWQTTSNRVGEAILGSTLGRTLTCANKERAVTEAICLANELSRK